MEYVLEVIPKIGPTSAQHAAFIKASYDAGGVFRHIAKGRNNSVHRKIIVEAISALLKAGKSIEQVEFEMKSPVYAVGNTSQWGKMLNDSLNWVEQIENEDGEISAGKKITFAAHFSDKVEPATNLTAI